MGRIPCRGQWLSQRPPSMRIARLNPLSQLRIRGYAAAVQIEEAADDTPTKDLRQLYRNIRAAKPKKMHITASVLLSRPPLLFPDLHPFEAQIQRYQAMIERHYYTDFPINFHFKKGSIGEKRWKLEHPIKPKVSASGIIRPLRGSGEPEWILGGNSDQRVMKARRVAEVRRRQQEMREEKERAKREEEEAAAAEKAMEERKAKKQAEAVKAEEEVQEVEQELEAEAVEKGQEEKVAEAKEPDSPDNLDKDQKKLAKAAKDKREKGMKVKSKKNSEGLTDDEKRDLEQYAQEEKIEDATRDILPEFNADLHRLEREPQRTLYCIVKRSQGYHEWSGKKERRWQLIGMGAQSETGTEGLHVVAQKAIDRHLGTRVQTWVVGTNPAAYLSADYKAPISIGKRNFYSTREFIMKAHIFAGAVRPKKTYTADYAWVTSDELAEMLDPKTLKVIRPLLADI